MPMEWEMFESRLAELTTGVDNPETVGNFVTSMSEQYSNDIKEHETMQERISQLEKDNERLSNANTELILKAPNSFAPPESQQRKKQMDELKDVSVKDILERKLV